MVTGMYDSGGTRLSGFGAMPAPRTRATSATRLRIFFTPETSGDHYIEFTARAHWRWHRDASTTRRGLSYTLELWEPAGGPLAITASAT